MGGLFLAHISDMCGIGMIEGLAIDVLGMVWKMSPDGIGKIVVRPIGHTASLAERGAAGYPCTTTRPEPLRELERKHVARGASGRFQAKSLSGYARP